MLKEVHFFDIDGMLRIPKSAPLVVARDRLTHPRWAKTPSDFRWIHQDYVSSLKQSGALCIGATNQGGLNILRWRDSKDYYYKDIGYLKEECDHLFTAFPLDAIMVSPGPNAVGLFLIFPGRSGGVKVKVVPGTGDWAGGWHKPGAAMLMYGAARWEADAYFFYGDRTSDEQAAARAQGMGLNIQFKYEWDI